jgi:L-arabinose isomerase
MPPYLPTPPLRIGLFGIGLDTYWPQFTGLKQRLEGYLGRVAQKLAISDVEIVNLGLVDTPEKAWQPDTSSGRRTWT